MKNDRGKARYDLLPWALIDSCLGWRRKQDEKKLPEPPVLPLEDLLDPEAIAQLQYVLSLGVAKYGLRNWASTSAARRRYFAATVRHLVAWWLGRVFDSQSRQSPLAHAAATVLILLSLEAPNDRVR